jgi:hypothetical protein
MTPDRAGQPGDAGGERGFRQHVAVESAAGIDALTE